MNADPRSDKWDVLVAALDGAHAGSGGVLAAALAAADETGARLFEVIAGTPARRYGARLTFSGGARFAAAVGAAPHPWGDPDWVGVRVVDGRLRVKLYHRAGRAPRVALPPGMPGDLYPIMAARDGDATEVYLRAAFKQPWADFAAACARPLGLAPVDDAVPRPSPREDAYAASVRFVGDRATAVTVYADHRALPDHDAICRAWSAALSDEERRAYEAQLAAVRSLGRRLDNTWHGMLAWTVEADGLRHRAASLRPPTSHAAPR